MPEIVIIVLAIAVLLFGGSKITEIARSMGSAAGEFKKAKRNVEKELRDAEETETQKSSVTAAAQTDATAEKTE